MEKESEINEYNSSGANNDDSKKGKEEKKRNRHPGPL